MSVQAELRRIIAVEAHRRRTGRCPVRLHSLGTGETFDIKPTDNGFVDVATGLNVRAAEGSISVPGLPATVDFRLNGDVGFDGFDHHSNEPFSGRAGGGASVTLYDRGQRNYFQYAVVAEDDPI